MILYSEDTSPWCAPARAAIYAKALDIRVAAPPGGVKSEEYRRLSGTGLIPCLVLDDGEALPESAVIVGYLDERFPEPPLRPADPEGRARVALLLRLAESGVMAPLVQFFHDMTAGDAGAGAKAAAGLSAGLARLERFVAADGYAAGPAFSQADCFLGPALFGVKALGPMLGAADLLGGYPRLAAYDARVIQHPAVARVVGELAAALAASGLGAAA
jgi:glutathione S-transferase